MSILSCWTIKILKRCAYRVFIVECWQIYDALFTALSWPYLPADARYIGLIRTVGLALADFIRKKCNANIISNIGVFFLISYTSVDIVITLSSILNDDLNHNENLVLNWYFLIHNINKRGTYESISSGQACHWL